MNGTEIQQKLITKIENNEGYSTTLRALRHIFNEIYNNKILFFVK